jgi:hypothetical protein
VTWTQVDALLMEPACQELDPETSTLLDLELKLEMSKKHTSK